MLPVDTRMLDTLRDLWRGLAAPPLESLTLVTPHLDLSSGGTFVIRQLAALLAPTCRVNLVVQYSEPVPVPGVHVVRSADLDPAQVPDAAAIGLYADAPAGDAFAALPPSKGRKFILLQGYGTPGAPVVVANLARGYPVMASAGWTRDAARAAGCPAARFPYGVDRAVFFPGPADRPRRVSMMVSGIDWKATPEGLEALAEVRRTRPDVEVVLFGSPDPGFPGARFLSRPSREVIAGLLRESAVFVCSSWEEGFGMPGLEAQFCGAALATTDTRGSRDYALHERTALVSPPRQPRALAKSILRLLDDDGLRRRLVHEARILAHEDYPEWPAAARLFERRLAALLASSRPPAARVS